MSITLTLHVRNKKSSSSPYNLNENPGEKEWNISTLSLTSTKRGVGGQRHTPTALPPRKRPGTHCTACWVGPRAGLGGCEESGPHRYCDSRTVQPVVSHYTD